MLYIWLTIFVLSTNVIDPAKSLSAITLTTNTTLTEICPLTTPVECLCNGTGVLSLTWKINSELIRTVLNSQSPSEPAATEYPGVQVQLISVVHTGNDRGNMSTRLIVEPTALNFGDQISCNNASITETLNYTQMASPPAVSVVPNISKEAGNSVKLTLQWDNVFTETHSVDEYCVIAPAGSVCQSETTCLTPDTDYECSGLVAGNQYGFVVYAKNCGNQLGATTTSIITPRVPRQPTTCMSVPVYDKTTERLIAIQNSWTVALNPVEIAHGVHQNVLWYNITFERDGVSNGSKTISTADSCTTQKCDSIISTSFFGSHYTASVAAENIAGLGEHLTCTPDHISTSNTMLQVTANTSVPEHATVECQLPTLPAAKCRVCYGNSGCSGLTCLPSVNTNNNGRAIVSLPRLQRNLSYCYTAAIVVDNDDVLSVVQGSFSSECDEKDLVCRISPTFAGSKNILDMRCGPDSIGSLSIPNGVVCYNGTTLGSTASYICNDGFEVSTDNSQRVCQTDGHWDGDIAECSKSGNSTETLRALAIVFGLMLMITVGLFVASLIYTCTLKHGEKQSNEHSYVNRDMAHTRHTTERNTGNTNGHTTERNTGNMNGRTAEHTTGHTNESINGQEPLPSCYMLATHHEVPETNKASKSDAEYEEIPDYFKSLNLDGNKNNYEPYSRVGHR